MVGTDMVPVLTLHTLAIFATHFTVLDRGLTIYTFIQLMTEEIALIAQPTVSLPIILNRILINCLQALVKRTHTSTLIWIQVEPIITCHTVIRISTYGTVLNAAFYTSEAVPVVVQDALRTAPFAIIVEIFMRRCLTLGYVLLTAKFVGHQDQTLSTLLTNAR